MLKVLPKTEANDIRRRRSSISQNSFDIVFLKNLIFNKTHLNFDSSMENKCIKNYLRSKIINFYDDGNILEVEDQDFKKYLLNEANLQLNKALYNLSIYKQIVSRGLWTWAYITLYYAQFYAINGLLNIQGNSFSRASLLTTKGNLFKHALFHIYPKDFQAGLFYFERRRYNQHDDLWRQYHKIYEKYRYNLQDYHYLYEYDRSNNRGSELKMKDLRHKLNYDVAALSQDFLEYDYSEDEMTDLAMMMSQNSLEYDFNEDEKLEIEYIATLRVKLIFDLLHEIFDSPHLQNLRISSYEKRKNMLLNVKDETCVSQNFLNWVNNANSKSL